MGSKPRIAANCGCEWYGCREQRSNYCRVYDHVETYQYGVVGRRLVYCSTHAKILGLWERCEAR